MKRRCFFLSVVLILALLCWWRWRHHSPTLHDAEKQFPLPASSVPAPRDGNGAATASMPTNSAVDKAAAEAEYKHSRLEKLRSIVQKSNKPIQFFGLVLDQDNNPVPDVKVTLEIRVAKEVAPGVVDDLFENPILMTGRDGRFTLTDARGALLGIKALEKPGYEPSEKAFRKSYWYWRDPSQVFHPDAARPEVFRMWKRAGAEKLVRQERMTRIPYDGRVVVFDLLSGRETTVGGDLRVALLRTPQQVKWGQRNYEWTLTVEPLDGGIIVSSDEQMFRAPADGYQPRLVVHMPADDPKWTDEMSVELYLKSQGGKHYSAVKLDVMVGSEKPATGLSFRSYLNPTGSRNLEYDPLQDVVPSARPQATTATPKP